MKNINKILLLMGLSILQLHASGQELQPTDTQALQLIGAMQESVKFHRLAEEQIKNINNSVEKLQSYARKNSLGIAVGFASQPINKDSIKEQYNQWNHFKKESNKLSTNSAAITDTDSVENYKLN